MTARSKETTFDHCGGPALGRVDAEEHRITQDRTGLKYHNLQY